MAVITRRRLIWAALIAAALVAGFVGLVIWSNYGIDIRWGHGS